MLREPEASGQDLVACNDTRESIETDYSVRDVGSGEVVAEGRGIAAADCVTRLARIWYSEDRKRFYVIEWTDGNTRGTNHYLAGKPPFELRQYREWLKTAGLQCQCESRKQGPPQE
jgi:beta-mannosidase